MVEYVYKPFIAAFWVILLGYVVASLLNLKRKSHIKKFAKQLYVSHKEIIQQIKGVRALLAI
jgi:F420-0:gamma-glutamyl ligase-like protein